MFSKLADMLVRQGSIKAPSGSDKYGMPKASYANGKSSGGQLAFNTKEVVAGKTADRLSVINKQRGLGQGM